VIDTAVPGMQFTDILPNMAKELNRFAVLRSWNPQNGSHGTADQFVMSGRKFNAALHYPTYGSVISWHKGFKNALPPFAQLGSSVDRRFGGGLAVAWRWPGGGLEFLVDQFWEQPTMKAVVLSAMSTCLPTSPRRFTTSLACEPT